MKDALKLVRLIVVCVVVIAVVIGGIAFYNKFLKEETETVVNPISIEETIRDIGELATAEYGYTLLQSTDKPAKKILDLIELSFTESRVMYSYSGEIKAGIQFGEIEVTINEAGKTVYIKLPQAEILSREVFYDTLTVYDAKYSKFNQFTMEDLNTSLEDLQATAEKEALDRGLLEQAAENAKRLIESSIRGMKDYQEYEVQFY